MNVTFNDLSDVACGQSRNECWRRPTTGSSKKVGACDVRHGQRSKVPHHKVNMKMSRESRLKWAPLSRGPSTNDVSGEGEKGWPAVNFVLTREEQGIKNPKESS